MYLQMDGGCCPSDYDINVRPFLTKIVVISLSAGAFAFYFEWRPMKQRIYSNPINSEADLRDRTIN